MNPVLLVVAGPNGSGKTTVTVALRRDRWSENVEYINLDEIAQERFGDWNSPQAILSAATCAESSRASTCAGLKANLGRANTSLYSNINGTERLPVPDFFSSSLI
jgi:predicted ABC-type ATPase